MNLVKALADRAIKNLWYHFPQYRADGLAVFGRNLAFLEDLEPAWKEVAANNSSLPGGLPDVRWRAHIAVWAARNAIALEGDLVECGVFTGLLSTAIFNSLSEFNGKNFWLLDTHEGIPIETTSGDARILAKKINESYYSKVDAEAIVRAAIGRFPHARIVKGVLPGSLPLNEITKISYLSIDLNNAEAEMGVMAALWDRIVPGAIILVDDYGFAGHISQQVAWDQFCRDKRTAIATLPTGQGLIIRPPS